MAIALPQRKLRHRPAHHDDQAWSSPAAGLKKKTRHTGPPHRGAAVPTAQLRVFEVPAAVADAGGTDADDDFTFPWAFDFPDAFAAAVVFFK